MSEKKKSLRINDFQTMNRPRERLLYEGSQVLSDGELLAIILRIGTKGKNAVELGNQILHEFGGFSGIQKADITALCDIEGIGVTKAVQIKAAIELGNRLLQEKNNLKVSITTPQDAVNIVGYELMGKEQEELWVILLNTRNNFIRKDRLYKGSLNSSSVRVGEIFKSAIRNNAKSIILFHNHPSGDSLESPEDIDLTKAVIQAGKLIDVDLLDHIIIAASEFNSLRKKHPELWQD